MLSVLDFWWYVTAACIAWFSSITLYVAVRGGLDIKHMLRRLKDRSGGQNFSDDSGSADSARNGAER